MAVLIIYLTHLAIQDVPVIGADVILCKPVSAVKPHAPCKLLRVFHFHRVMQQAIQPMKFPMHLLKSSMLRKSLLQYTSMHQSLELTSYLLFS